jgi:hypothetical protein
MQVAHKSRVAYKSRIQHGHGMQATHRDVAREVFHGLQHDESPKAQVSNGPMKGQRTRCVHETSGPTPTEVFGATAASAAESLKTGMADARREAMDSKSSVESPMSKPQQDAENPLVTRKKINKRREIARQILGTRSQHKQCRLFAFGRI